MVTTEREDELEDWPEAGDPLRIAVAKLILTVMQLSTSEPQRARAVTEVIEAETRIRAALKPAANGRFH
jgi:hypothetical protein